MIRQPLRGGHGRRRGLLLMVCLFLLLASGRMDSGDANAELAGSMNLVGTGSLGTNTPYADKLIQSLFVHAPNGRYYEAHDPGNALLMTPAAFGGMISSVGLSHVMGAENSSSDAQVRMLTAKTLAALIETAFSAVSCFYLFLLFGLFYKPRTALTLTGLFVFASLYTAYFRSAWDVLPACNSVIVLLYYSARLVLAPRVRASEAFPVALWFGIACMFRFSLAPFLAIGVVILLWGIRKRTSASAILVGVCTAIAMLIPTLIFNAIRFGSPLRSASTLPQFQDQISLTGSIREGMFGLLLSPNRGLFVFSPLLLLLVLLPWYWKLMPAGVKALLEAYLPSTVLYYLMISKLHNWGAAGWGPRYLIPVLPILFLGAGPIAHRLWLESRIQRFLLVSLCVIAFLLSLPTLLVNHSNASLQYPDAFDRTAPYPIQQIAVWKNLLAGFQGQTVQARPNLGTDEMSRLAIVFPDLLIMRAYKVLAGRSKLGAQVLLLIYLSLLGCTAYLVWFSLAGVHSLGPLQDDANDDAVRRKQLPSNVSALM